MIEGGRLGSLVLCDHKQWGRATECGSGGTGSNRMTVHVGMAF